MSDSPTERWRELYRLALKEMNVPRRKKLIDQTRFAIFDRMLELCDLSGSHGEERDALEAAICELLKAETRENPESAA